MATSTDMSTDMQIRLADFGFSKMLAEGETTMTGLCGTKVGWCYPIAGF